ncbi:collagenase [Nocardia sp. NRRL S-836]|uniref:collagenase n=1 Tax=Nocardia sp. NRRL S-836 TaxID=1519492 RepID=UPI0006AFF966|nr:collagenase [Nocardia sp. NRRL S-836]KOV84607.1 microbial collagenase, secreted [Nocardia sp. NRRL S-836]
MDLQGFQRRFSLVLLAVAVALGATSVLPAQADSASPAKRALPTGADTSSPHVARSAFQVDRRPPRSASSQELRRDYDSPQQTVAEPRPSMSTARTAVAACNASEFTSRTGGALVDQIRASTTECVNTLFSLTGSEAYHAFREAQMASVAYGLRDNGTAYAGNNSAGTAQLALYLRAGYYVQWYHPSDVGQYGPTLRTAIQSGLDSFFANPRAFDVGDANGEVLSEAVTLIDSSEQNARYLSVVKRLLSGYNSTYDSSWWMLNAVNNVYTVLFRGHQVPEFVSTVRSDPSITDALHNFASSHLDLLSGPRGYLTSNAGRELGRFLQHTTLHPKVRSQAKNLLDISSIRGATAALWVGVAEMTESYDKANCTYYVTCDLQTRLAAEVLPINHSCSTSLRIRAQQMTSTELSQTCASLLQQDTYFHSVVTDPGPVSGDRNTSLEVVVYDSSTDYQTYAGVMWGIDTNNGGMYLEGDPSAVGNQARFIAYEAEWLRPTFAIWNLNHEYTHYLDGRFDMYGDFTSNVSTPTVWWIEGFAEYISYHYRRETYDAAIAEAGKRSYALSTLLDTTYSHDTTRIYRWGYLAVRYMLQSHRADMNTVLGYYRTGNWNAARTFLKNTIGTRYDSDWYSWLSACAAGNCGGGGGGNQTPTADFVSAVSGLTVTFTDRSRDADGTIAARRWDFGDGTTSTATNPTKSFAATGSYQVTLTVTDNQGATATTTRQIAVGGATQPECAGADNRELGKNCSRSNRGTSPGNYDYLYVYVPSGATDLRITTIGGTGDCDLYYNPTAWATTSAHTQRSTGNNNSEAVTIATPPVGHNYVSLHGKTAGCAGVTVTATFAGGQRRVPAV